ncbi:Disease resistance protein RPM1 [Forsythia ovata]|uniref:Disease resistance protein RPM1 n=1 Tax=Forsythia ovata TaxID=205694 RepID=A0ABD1VHD1_9LAMI
MAEIAVYFLIEKLTIILNEKVQLFKGVKQDFEYVRDELERMVAFLRVADGFEESDPELKVWVKQVREIAYDTEDVIDKFLLHSKHDHSRRGIHGFLGKLYFSIKKLKFTRKVSAEIRSIISRVRNIAQGHQRYRYKLSIQEQGSSSGFLDFSVTDRRGDALLLEEGELVGIENPKQNLIRLLMEEDPGLKVISVVGMGGLGKTTLVKRVFDDAVVKKHFHNHAWLTVSQFKIEDLLKDMIQQLFDEIKQPLPERIGSMNSNRLKEIIREFLRRRRYVLVFDDVWSIPAWEAIKYALPNENHGSRIILTTRLINVASASCIETDGYMYELKPLSEEESWTLFCQKAFQGNSCPQHLIEICSNILRKCGGLPLAIVAVGGLLATKNTLRVSEWEMLNQSLGPELEGNDKLESMKNILLLSFNDLPYYLKPCFLYLSIYPEDHLIEHNILIRLWIMEGFVKQKEGRTVEEVAEGYLNELINRSLIFMVKTNDDGSLKYGHIHDLYREVILSKAREQNFVTTANEQKTMWPGRVRRLSIHNTLEHALKGIGGLISLRKLGYMEASCGSDAIKEISMMTELRRLRVIVEEDAMPHLEKLVIQRCNLLQRIPRGIEHLIELKVVEFFDMPDEFITTMDPNRLGEDYCKVAHIPEVYYTFWRDGGWEIYPLDQNPADENSRQPRTVIRTQGRRNSLVSDAAEEVNPELKVWVKQVRDVAYDTEDIIDEFMLHLTHECHHRVDSAGHQRYRYKLNVLEEGSSSFSTCNIGIARQGDALLVDECELVGIENAKQKLIQWVLEGDPKFKVVSVVGMGGSGKTTLVKKVYDNALVKKHFDNHAWIMVSGRSRLWSS